ncbi:acyl-CoA dehydrogenase family protein [Rhodoferax ferrireducens]|nr:acyl-CoA dehydrogenase family protein [Rhodoferax ferrireducens]WPC67968.1 acyl-CoA dehydrogenase family protein [Rhodoferax ferrireducens]
MQEGEAFGQPIAQFQNTGFKLAEVATQIAVAESFTKACIDANRRGDLPPPAASAIRLPAGELF